MKDLDLREVVSYIKDLEDITTLGLQRQFCLGHSKARKIMDDLKSKGIVNEFVYPIGQTVNKEIANNFLSSNTSD
jgi:hypothetical protein